MNKQAWLETIRKQQIALDEKQQAETERQAEEKRDNLRQCQELSMQNVKKICSLFGFDASNSDFIWTDSHGYTLPLGDFTLEFGISSKNIGMINDYWEYDNPAFSNTKGRETRFRLVLNRNIPDDLRQQAWGVIEKIRTFINYPKSGRTNFADDEWGIGKTLHYSGLASPSGESLTSLPEKEYNEFLSSLQNLESEYQLELIRFEAWLKDIYKELDAYQNGELKKETSPAYRYSGDSLEEILAAVLGDIQEEYASKDTWEY